MRDSLLEVLINSFKNLVCAVNLCTIILPDGITPWVEVLSSFSNNSPDKVSIALTSYILWLGAPLIQELVHKDWSIWWQKTMHRNSSKNHQTHSKLFLLVIQQITSFLDGATTNDTILGVEVALLHFDKSRKVRIEQ